MSVKAFATILAYTGQPPVRPETINQARFNAMVRSALDWLDAVKQGKIVSPK